MLKIQPYVSFIKELYHRLNIHNATGLSAQLSYFFLLSFFPLLITIFSLLPFLPIKEEDILLFLQDFAPEKTMAIIQYSLQEVLANQNGKLLSVGIIITLWSAAHGMNGIIRAMNEAYEVQENRPFWIVRGISIVLTVAMIFVILLALFLPVFGKHIGIYLFSKFGFANDFLAIWDSLRWGVSSLILFTVFSFLYFFTPSKKIQCVEAIPGAFLSTIGWIGSSLIFSYYVDHFSNYANTYGSLGGIIILLIWLYLSGYILIIGGEVNALISKKKADC